MESARSLNSKLQSIEKDKQELQRRSSSEEKPSEPKIEISNIKVEPMDIEEDQPLEQLKENIVSNVSNDVKIEAESNFPPSKIEGFEDWNLPMIRDFIGCMDTARKKYATLKEQEPEGQVKLVPLLLEEWKLQYPETSETVKTILAKIKHLKTQKESIKKDLNICGLLPKIETPAQDSASGANANVEPVVETVKKEVVEVDSEFKWSREMIADVIESRKLAKQIQGQQLAGGKRLSFHTLWASEFKKIHPTSTFTSNNLSVHFWTWRKQQQKLQSKKQIKSEPPINPPITNKKPMTTSNGTFKSEYARDKLLEIGRKVEQMLQNPQTPNELKLKGFANVLHEEWSKEHPSSTETSRSLNMMYSRIIRQEDTPCK